MLEFIAHLNVRYQCIQAALVEKKTVYQNSIEQLTLLEAFLRKESMTHVVESPLNIAIMGPTQSGKSSLVNCLLNKEIAGVSPLAGFTVHPQGFSVGLNAAAIDDYFSQYFLAWPCVAQQSLNNKHYDCYSLTHVGTHKLPACIVWDTPDFDSINAQAYQAGVLKTIALADILILVVSKEKYADQSVWDMLLLLAPLHQPIIIVINKVLAGSKALIIDSFKSRWQETRQDSLPVIYSVLFTHDSSTQWNEISAILQAKIRDLLKGVKRKKYGLYSKKFIELHWDAWVLPLKIEQAAKAQWLTWVEEGTEEAVLLYRRDYLEHPQHYDTFQNALAKLLTLLEIPVLANIAMQSRKILAWPLRRLFALTKKSKTSTLIKTQETRVLEQIASHVLLQLADKVLEQVDKSHIHQHWWKDINRQLRQDKSVILYDFKRRTEIYHIEFKQQIECAAHDLYQTLEEHPALLNGLRAMRVTTDAGLLALAVQAGGIGLHDLLIAPAMLSVTAYLTESAVGKNLQRSERKLKQQQMITVRQQLFLEGLQQALMGLPNKITETPYFNISAQQLATAEAQLKVKPHGLRVF